MGVLALLSARLLNIRCSVLAQPQVPDYVNQMTDDPNFELMAENYLDWFYDQADRVFCQSPAEKQRLVAQGVTAECLDQSGIDDPSKAKAAALEAEVV
ncbi:MAG: hypothetical protein M2R45_00203 [Verrucomicrobia subdivision 3 bacterium]|nr:hypothetical protein [Limisphaerales bacterium]MCS1412338.1 hypothetical protein [Limisphaerales bacterium]